MSKWMLVTNDITENFTTFANKYLYKINQNNNWKTKKIHLLAGPFVKVAKVWVKKVGSLAKKRFLAISWRAMNLKKQRSVFYSLCEEHSPKNNDIEYVEKVIIGNLTAPDSAVH